MEEVNKNDNIIGTLVDCLIDSSFIVGKLSWKFTKWCFDGWVDLEKPKFNILFEEIKLYNSNKKNKPILKKENHTNNTDVYIFTIPTGLSILDFTKRKEQIAQFLHTDLQHIKIENINNLAAITVYKEGNIEYFYEDYKFPPTKNIQIPLGVSLDNWNTVYWNPFNNNETHMFVGGSTGSGKSSAINIILAYLVEHRTDVELYLQDCKQVDLVAFKMANITSQYNSGIDYAEETTQLLVNEMKERYTYLAENNCKSISDCNKKDKPPYIFYVIDELNFFKPKTDNIFYDNLALLLSQGRAAGINCIISSQSCYSDLLPGPLKNNICVTLGLRCKTKEASTVVCGEPDLINLRGKGHGKLFTTEGVEELQVFNIKEKTIEKIVAKNKKTDNGKEDDNCISADFKILD